MTPTEPMTDHQWNVVWGAFVRRLAEHQGRALAGDHRSQQILGEYELCRYCGHRTIDALAVAESMYDAA